MNAQQFETIANIARLRGRTVEVVQKLGRKALLVVADVTDSRQVHEMALKAKEIGHMDMLVNSVGIAPMSCLANTMDERWDEVLKTSLFSAFYYTREFAGPMMENRWRRIINIGGLPGYEVPNINPRTRRRRPV